MAGTFGDHLSQLALHRRGNWPGKVKIMSWVYPVADIFYVAKSFSVACVCALLLYSCLTLCDPTDCSPSGSSVHGILHAWTLEWAAISFSKGSSWPRDWTQIANIAGRFFTAEPPGKTPICYHNANITLFLPISRFLISLIPPFTSKINFLSLQKWNKVFQKQLFKDSFFSF